MLYIYLALFSALTFSLSDITTKYLLDNGVSNLQYLFWGQGMIYILLTIVTIIIATIYSYNILTNGDSLLKVINYPSGKLGLIIFVSAILSFLGFLSLIYAFKISINIGYTASIVGTTSLMTFFFSWLFFKKKTEFKGLIGAISILFGVFLISKCDNNINK